VDLKADVVLGQNCLDIEVWLGLFGGGIRLPVVDLEGPVVHKGAVVDLLRVHAV
jgi:hypothetical protein